MFTNRRILITLGAIVSLISPLCAQLPGARLFTVAPLGGKQGTTFDLTVGGADLDDARELYFSQPGITASRKMAPPGPFQKLPQPVANVFTVTITPDATPGNCDVRVVSRFGVSNPRAFQIGTLAEVNEAEPNNQPAQAQVVALESIVNGAVGGGTDIDCFKISLKAGQHVFADCFAQRLDSRLDPVLVLCDAAGTEIERIRDANRRDPLADFTAPSDGDFIIKLYDAVYAGSPEHFYRMAITTAPRVDFVFPQAGVAGAKAPLVLYGRSLPGGQPAPGVTIAGKPLVKLPIEVDVPAGPATESLVTASTADSQSSPLDVFTYRLPAPLGVTDPLSIGFATAPVVLEVEPNNSPPAAQKVAAPCEVAGQFYPQNDEDWFAFDVKAGEVFVIEVFSQRLGTLTDPFLLVQHVKKNEKGEEQVQELQGMDDLGGNVGGANFDTGSDDSAFRLQSPADGVCRVFVRDQYSATSADPRNLYRLSIRREAPDFRLVAVPKFPGANADPNANPPNVWNPLLRRGGTDLFEVLALRRDGFGGEIQVTVEGLPSWVSSSSAVLGPGDTSAPLILTAAPDAVDWIGAVEVVGKARVGDKEVVRRARPGAVVWPGVENTIAPRSRVARSLVVGVTSEAVAFTVEAPGGVLEMSRGGTLQIPVTLTRRGDFKGPVALAAVGLPANVGPKNITLDPNTATANFELGIQPGAPVGTYTFHLHATSQVSYSRNPEAVKAATDRKAELDQAVADAAASAKVSAEAKAAADKTAGEATQALAKATEAQSKSTGEGKAAADQLKAAADELKKVADGIKAAADKVAAESDAKSKAAAEAQTAAQKAIEAAQNAAKPQNMNVAFASTPITLRIAQSPIAIAAFGPAVPLKQGQKIEIPVVVTRLFGFAEGVQIAGAVPQGVAGLSLPAVTLAAGQSHVVIPVTAAADATPGDHVITVTATAKFGGQDMQATHSVTLKVEKP